MLRFFIKTFYIFLFQFCVCDSASAFSKDKNKENIITIAIPVNEEVLMKKDPYFVYLKRAYKSLNIPVEFLMLPGARSYKMLQKGKIAGSYPRYSIIANDSKFWIITSGFEIKQNIYAFSQKPIESSCVIEYALKYQPNNIGTVRGIRVIESYLGDEKIRLFNHIDHLIGALKAGKLNIVLETENVMNRYKQDFTTLYRSPEPIIKGNLTQILHRHHQDIADKLANYFIQNPLN